MSDLESEIENEWDEPALDPALEGDEPTELEVQQMLDGTPDVPEPAPKRPKRQVVVIPEYPVMTAMPVAPKRPGRQPKTPRTPGHALDVVPVHSKIVVVIADMEKFAVLSTPTGANRLPPGDPAHGLPEGARIMKVAEGKFRATQLSPAIEQPVLETNTAIAAIRGFIPHFHGTETVPTS